MYNSMKDAPIKTVKLTLRCLRELTSLLEMMIEEKEAAEPKIDPDLI